MAWNLGWKVAALLLPLGGMLVGSAASSRITSPDAHESVAAGSLAYRRADFDQAENFYRQALAVDPRCVRALLGLGMVEDLRFRRGAARAHFGEAYRIAPRDPQVIRYYASVAASRDEETALLRQYIATGGEDSVHVEIAMARIGLNEKLAGRETDILDSPYRAYTIPMKPYCPTAQPAGMLLSVAINDTKPLRLLFDTGAERIVIRRSAAEKLGLEYLGRKEFRGLGGGGRINGKIALARSLSIGELRLRNSILDVSDSLPSGVDGVIGPALLQRFLIRFSASERRLELLPFAEESDSNRTISSGAKAVQLGHLLLVKARVDGESAGHFLLDTGAGYSLVSRDLRPQGQNGAAAIHGVGGRAEGERLSPVRFQFAQEPLIDFDAMAYDFRELNRQTGVELSGLIGYRALSQKTLTINYRDGLIDAGR